MASNIFGEFLPDFDIFSLFSNLVNVGIIVGGIIIAAVMVFLAIRYKKSKKDGTYKEVHWYDEIHGELTRVRVDKAKEITVPGTNLRLFYIRAKDLWLPRFTRGVDVNTFNVVITKNKELVNFTLGGIEAGLKEAGLQYDHTDMRWAAENLREFVKRNYRDKAIPWWKEYAQTISTAIMIVMMTFSFAVIIYFLRGVVTDIGVVSNGLNIAIEKINACSPGSGIVLGK